MTERIMNPKVDEFLNKSKKWKEEYAALRRIALARVLDCLG